jgi:DNA-directed RNA polymerase specialized sigma24 family protein
MRSELMSELLLSRARAGDGSAFRELTDPFPRELQLHCYRILGSAFAATNGGASAIRPSAAP